MNLRSTIRCNVGALHSVLVLAANFPCNSFVAEFGLLADVFAYRAGGMV